LPPAPAFSEDAIASALPGGASSLQETYDDWMVACAVNDQATHQKLCTLSTSERLLRLTASLTDSHPPLLLPTISLQQETRYRKP
jgi:hypothetical protein